MRPDLSRLLGRVVFHEQFLELPVNDQRRVWRAIQRIDTLNDLPAAVRRLIDPIIREVRKDAA